MTDIASPSLRNRRVAAHPASLVLMRDPTGRQAEALRGLRTHVVARHVNEGRRSLAICAPSQGVGCSFVAANLAVALAQIGVKTLLIDADLRRPSIDAMFPAEEPSPGLMQILDAEGAGFDEGIRRDVEENLSIMFAGGAPANPQELLGGTRFKALMEFCLREFDATIVDTPAANACADARRITSVIGYGLIVVRRNQTYVDDVRALTGQIEADGAHVVGTVLNEG